MSDLQIKQNIQPRVLLAFAHDVQAALKKAALDTQGQARDVVPVKTGNLKGSIQADLSRVAALTSEVTVGAEYGAYVEYGTYKQAAQPYIIPAFRRCGEALKAALRKLNFKGG